MLPENGTELHLLTNNGSLYYLQSTDGKAFIFASERFIIHQLIDDLNKLNFKLGSLKAA